METFQDYIIPWVFALCVYEDKILLMKRKKDPNKNLWNGMGGKIMEDESQEDALFREVLEETGLRIGKAKRIGYKGIVAWDMIGFPKRGMHVYIVEFEKQVVFEGKKETREGLLEWKEISWATNKNNKDIVENIPYFLPEMLKNKRPMWYRFEHNNPGDARDITKFTIEELR